MIKTLFLVGLILLLLCACIYDPGSRIWLTYSGADPAYIGQTMQITAETSHPDASVSWRIRDTYPVSAYPDTQVATIDSSGRVSLVNYGSFTVEAWTDADIDSMSFTFYADPDIVGTWNGPDTLILHKSGILDTGSTQNGAWYTTETQIYLEYLGGLRNYQLTPGISLEIDLDNSTTFDGGESFIP